MYCVKKDDREIEWFPCVKDAEAWSRHVFGDDRKGVSIGKRPTPRPGDAVDGPDGEGVLCHVLGSLAVCYQPSTFREDTTVSCSGGPLPWVDSGSLKPAGLRRIKCWRWSAGLAGAGQGGEYWVTVPLWKWEGSVKKAVHVGSLCHRT